MYNDLKFQYFKAIIALNRPLDSEKFILANLDFAAFYRVNYDTENWRTIIKQLISNKTVRTNELLLIISLTKVRIFCLKAIILNNTSSANQRHIQLESRRLLQH